MSQVYLCGSFKYVETVEEVERVLDGAGVSYLSSKTPDPRGIVSCLEKIDAAQAVYVVNPDGYIGKSVSVDFGFAYARAKPIYSMRPIEDPPLADLTAAVLTPAELARKLS